MTSVGKTVFNTTTRLVEGNKTSTVYALIRDQKYEDAAKLLNIELLQNQKSRAALSLLGYCYFYTQDFHAAASTYVEKS